MSEATLTEAQQVMVDAMTEKQLQAAIVKCAKTLGYLVYHPYDSRRSEYGYPDLTMVHPRWNRMVIAELKTENGKVSDAQQCWLDALGPISDWFSEDYCAVFVRLWRPSDWHSGAIERVLRDGDFDD